MYTKSISCDINAYSINLAILTTILTPCQVPNQCQPDLEETVCRQSYENREYLMPVHSKSRVIKLVPYNYIAILHVLSHCSAPRPKPPLLYRSSIILIWVRAYLRRALAPDIACFYNRFGDPGDFRRK